MDSGYAKQVLCKNRAAPPDNPADLRRARDALDYDIVRAATSTVNPSRCALDFAAALRRRNWPTFRNDASRQLVNPHLSSGCRPLVRKRAQFGLHDPRK